MSEDLPIVEVGPVAHGGHCVARLDGQVVFVRHALPGERVRLRVTDESSSFLRADAVEVLEASPDRVTPPCPWATTCGGCDFQHAHPVAQRRLLGDVVREQLRRLAGIDWTGEVEEVVPALGWRTRMQYTRGGDGRLGLRAHRSHDVVAIDHCRIAHSDLPDTSGAPLEAERVEAVVSSTHQHAVIADGRRVDGPRRLTERVHHRHFGVAAGGFWQVHPRAAETLVDAVMAAAELRQGDRVADLYAGVGLFSAFAAEQVGTKGHVVSVEWDRTASAEARRNLTDLPQAEVRNGATERVTRSIGSADVVVLDPPRAGAKKAVRDIVGLAPRRIVYVSCDPASLARDLARFADLGYDLRELRSFALFPMTHHVECVAVLDARSQGTSEGSGAS
ncbi:class I SAM-dependent RNA methyltransferase [Aeromicrobium sp. Leaf350]|uniref:class I SAM-dependent RNA methyltransferase n=1 Tax=Aeromicrobium sp. Leaf350 TaxID=2876565 RepID=UPI001E45CC19|nr:TRAM domain-containing protein [Aeromicrobium sp. Leaf350]